MPSAEYNCYIASPQWAALKESHPDPKECVACGSVYKKLLHLHHMRYPANIWETEHSDCCWLCIGCHECFHRGIVAGRKQGHALAGTSKDFTKAVIRVERAQESYQPAGETLRGLSGEGLIAWLKGIPVSSRRMRA